MNKTTIIIYAVIVGFAILSSVLKKRKKANANNQPKPKSYNPNRQTSTYQQPKSTQPKSLEDILQSLLNESKPVKTTPVPDNETTTFGDNLEEKFQTTEDARTLEVKEQEYYSYDTELEYDEEAEDYDKLEDHRLHGKGFDEEFEPVLNEEKGEWEEIDWRKAVITAEILKRPEY